MLRLTVRNLRANKIRFALTTVGVVLAVSFVVSAFVLGDGLRSTFGTVAEDITAGTDLQVRPQSEFGEPVPCPWTSWRPSPPSTGWPPQSPSIEAAENAVRPLTAGGDAITVDGPPQLAFNWIDDEQLSPFSLVEGAPPAPGEFAIDLDSADRHGFVVGDRYELITPGGRTTLRLSGTTSFGEDNATLGAVLVQVSTAEAGALFGIDGVSTVDVRLAEGADPATVQAAVSAAVPGAEVVENAVVVDETASEFTDDIDVVGNILLGFGGVALFVSIFIVHNTFGIVLGQRTRELALLRTVGADPRQIRRSVLGEALVVGVIASAGGILGGIGMAEGLEALFAANGVDLSDHPVVLASRTVVAAVLVGIGVTVLAAVGPARAASTVPPMAALRGAGEASPARRRTRAISGLVLSGAGVAAGAAGLAGAGPTAVTVAAMAAGAVGVFLGVTLLSPSAVGIVTALVGWPARRTAGVAGRLAHRNAARNPRRTASTAAALMVGLALVSTALVVSRSVKAGLGSTIERSATADYYVTDELDDVDFPTTLVAELGSAAPVDAVTGFRYVEARVDGSVTDVVAADLDVLGTVLDLDVRAGTDPVSSAVRGTAPEGHGADPVLVSADEAERSRRDGRRRRRRASLANGSRVASTVAAVFHDQAILTEDYVVDTATFDAAGVAQGDRWVAFSVAEGADPAAVQALVTSVSDRYPDAAVETAGEFRQRLQGVVDDVLAMVSVMVALAVLIALIGIVNTMALSVLERTRELGLLRAVGMSRRQVRRMIRIEAALVATFGAVLGVGVGLLFGWGVVTALPESLAGGLEVPVGQILAVMAIAAAAGLVAAWLPARRAGRLDVLDAIDG